MINLRNSPFLWFALLLLLAYSIARMVNVSSWREGHIMLWVVCLSCSILGILKYNPGHQFRSTMAIGLLIIAAGMIRVTQFISETYSGDPIATLVRMEGMVEVKQVLKVKENGFSLRCQSMDLLLKADALQQRFTDKFLLVQIKEIDGAQIFPGDRMQVQGWVTSFTAPLNPHAFDIRGYYTTLGIRHQMYCKGKEIAIHPPSRNSFARITAKWQFKLSSIVKQHTSPEVAQLTNALVWGDRSDMADEVRDAFADSGAMHVLSVSGMHVAIIYSMLYLLLGAPGSGSFPRRMVRLGCYVLAILLYMGLTGACPAVVRAALMIILYLIGKAMGWNTPIWNLLGFAAFVMLWINPFIWMNVGFQLSFLAMAGILLYAQPMIRSLSFKNRILHITWEITAVSIAAQVFILPVLLKQFHQFPLTFIASSLVAMPASYVIIFGALLNVVLSFVGIDWLWPWFDKAGEYFILSMKWMAGLNPEMNFSLPVFGSLLLMAMAIIFSVALIYNWDIGKKIAYAFGILAFLTLGCHRSQQWNSDELVIYHQFKGLLADVIIDGHCVSIQDSSINEKSIEFATRGNRCHRDVIHIANVNKNEEYYSGRWSYSSYVLQFPSASMLVWTSDSIPATNELILSHILVDGCSDIHPLIDFICEHPDVMVILPGHLERKTKYDLLKFLKSQDMEYYDISQQGYFKLEL